MDVKEWRKRALNDELPTLDWMADDPVGFFKVLENVYTRCVGKGPRQHLDGVRLILAACASGVRDPRVAVRRPVVDLLDKLTSLLSRDYQAGMPGIYPPELVDWAERGLCDPGTDLDERGRPLAPKGTLVLAQKADAILLTQPRRNERRFDGALAGLERLDAWIMHELLEPGYSHKLVVHLLKVLQSLLRWGERLAPDALPRLIRFAGDTDYERIPAEELMSLLRLASRRREYVRPLIEAAAEPDCADVVWGLFRRELDEGGDNARHIRSGLEKTGAAHPFDV